MRGRVMAAVLVSVGLVGYVGGASTQSLVDSPPLKMQRLHVTDSLLIGSGKQKVFITNGAIFVGDGIVISNDKDKHPAISFMHEKKLRFQVKYVPEDNIVFLASADENERLLKDEYVLFDTVANPDDNSDQGDSLEYYRPAGR